MYYIYFKRGDNSKFKIGANVVLRSIDEETTRYSNREEQLFNVGLNRADSLPLDLSEKAYIVNGDDDVEYGEVLYSDCKDIFDIKGNKEKIINRFNNPELMKPFLEKYLELVVGKGINDTLIEEAGKILSMLKEKEKKLFPFVYAYFETLIEEISLSYDLYRYLYIANKSLEIEKRNVKIITKNIKGRRKIQ